MVSKQMRCLALISHNNMKPAMQARFHKIYSYITTILYDHTHATHTLL